MKKNKKLAERKVNLGCGSNMQKGWINIDVVRPENANQTFMLGSAMNIPLKANSVDYILMDQVLEHIPMADVIPVLYEVRRVLKAGGRCVIVVPDFEDAVRQWLNANLNATWDPMKYKWFSEVIYGNQAHEGEFHKTAMCARYLYEVSATVGFHKKDITFWPAFGEIPKYPGMRPYADGATLRNAQLVLDITKE